MRLFLCLMSAVLVFGASAHALTLVCEVTSDVEHGRTSTGGTTPSRVIESWSPKKQVHVLNLKTKTAVYKGPNFQTKLTAINDKSIKWKYVERLSDDSKTDYRAIIFKYHYVRGNHKLVTSVDFGSGYVKIVSTKGKCVER